MKKIVAVVLILTTVGCATGFRKKTLSYMGSAFVAGAVVGSSQTKERDNKYMHGALWGSAAATVVGAALVYAYSETYEVRERDNKIKELEQKMADFKNNSRISTEDGSSTFLEANLPPEYRHLVAPGKWRIYKVDEWKKSNDGEFVHHDKILELTPATVTIDQ